MRVKIIDAPDAYAKYVGQEFDVIYYDKVKGMYKIGIPSIPVKEGEIIQEITYWHQNEVEVIPDAS